MDNAVDSDAKKPNPLTRLGVFFEETWKDYLVLLLVAAAIISIDQWTKFLVRTRIPLGGDWLPGWLSWLAPIVTIRNWYNSGAAFGLFQNGNLIFSVLAVIVSCLILYYYPRTSRRDWWMRLALAMQFSGAVGNLIDRLTIRRVTDFIFVGGITVFNLADASISVGVAILVVGIWLRERAQKKQVVTAVDEVKGG